MPPGYIEIPGDICFSFCPECGDRSTTLRASKQTDYDNTEASLCPSRAVDQHCSFAVSYRKGLHHSDTAPLCRLTTDYRIG